jgi:hypothetical protein
MTFVTADAFAVADAMPSPITPHDLAAMADRDERSPLPGC